MRFRITWKKRNPRNSKGPLFQEIRKPCCGGGPPLALRPLPAGKFFVNVTSLSEENAGGGFWRLVAPSNRKRLFFPMDNSRLTGPFRQPWAGIPPLLASAAVPAVLHSWRPRPSARRNAAIFFKFLMMPLLARVVTLPLSNNKNIPSGFLFSGGQASGAYNLVEMKIPNRRRLAASSPSVFLITKN